jgi:hypothetical protein
MTDEPVSGTRCSALQKCKVKLIDDLVVISKDSPLNSLEIQLRFTPTNMKIPRWFNQNLPRGEDDKKVMVKNTTDMPSRCEGNVMFSKAHEASFHGHFANLPVEVCSILKLQPLTNNAL